MTFLEANGWVYEGKDVLCPECGEWYETYSRHVSEGGQEICDECLIENSESRGRVLEGVACPRRREKGGRVKSRFMVAALPYRSGFAPVLLLWRDLRGAVMRGKAPPPYF